MRHSTLAAALALAMIPIAAGAAPKKTDKPAATAPADKKAADKAAAEKAAAEKAAAEKAAAEKAAADKAAADAAAKAAAMKAADEQAAAELKAAQEAARVAAEQKAAEEAAAAKAAEDAAKAKVRTAFVTLTGGVLVPQVFGPLGVAPTPELAAGYFLPFLENRIALSVSFGYAQPSTTQKQADPRVPGDEFSYTLTVRDLRIAPGLQFHITPPSEAISIYVGGRARIHLMETTVDGSAGSPFGVSKETATEVGGAPFLGLFYKLGPGVLVGEVECDLAPVAQTITGNANVSAIGARVGYGLTF